MEKIREWSFPVMLICTWLIAAGYTMSSLAEAHARATAAQVRATNVSAAPASSDPPRS
jgi:hypothetical protein